MELECQSCQTPLAEEPTTQLLCGHLYHTRCFLHNLRVAIQGDLVHEIHCVSCDQHVFPPLLQQEEEQEQIFVPIDETQTDEEVQQEQTERQRVHSLWDTNNDFRKDLQKFMKSTRDSSKPRIAFQKLLATKKRELKEIYLPIQLRLEGIYNTKKDELMNSNECKDYRKASARSLRYYSLVREKYNLHGSSFRYLREKRGCKRLQKPFRRWCLSPHWMIRRAIRFRTKYW